MKLTPRVRVSLFTIFYVMALAILLDQIILPLYVNGSGEIRVPDLVGQSEESGMRILEKTGLTGQVKYRFEPKQPDRTILTQSPEGGAMVKAGRTVRLIVSQRDQIVAVPSVRLTTLRDATASLEAAGLQVGNIREEVTSEFPAGIVLQQSVSHPEMAKRGTYVDLVISVAASRTSAVVPFLVGSTLAQAKERIIDAGLSLGVVSKAQKADLLPGTVVAQTPDSGSVVLPQAKIDLVISTVDR